MHIAMRRIHEPLRAQAWFEDRLAFTTDPVELEHLLKMNGKIIVVDVREWEDFVKGHIPGALNLPQDKWGNLDGTSRDKTHVFYGYTQACHLAARACLDFASRGYPVMELDGGFAAWKAADLDVEHEPINRLRRHCEHSMPRRH
jgi:rhodanese-related sulfurtransferase